MTRAAARRGGRWRWPPARHDPASGAGSGFGVGVFAALSGLRWLEVTGPAAWLLVLDPLLAAIAVSVVCRLAFRRIARA